MFLSKYSHVQLILKRLRPLEQKDSERRIFPNFSRWSEPVSEICYHLVNPSRMTSFLASIQFSRSVISDSLRPHGLQHTRLPCPSPTPGACSNSCPYRQWWHPTKCPNLLLDKLIVTLINSFVYLSTVLTQMYLSHPFPGSSKRDWADTLPHSLWPKLLRLRCLDQLNSTQRYRGIFGAEGQTLDIRNSLWDGKWLTGLPSSQITPLSSTMGECFCPIAHLSNNTPRSI